MQRRRSTRIILLTAAILFLRVPSSEAANVMVSQFSHTCVASRSIKDLKDALAKGGWKPFASLAETRIARDIATVTPMLDAQGLSSDYIVYGLDTGDQHLELALSETKRPVSGDRKLVGCSLYDFDATVPVDNAVVGTFAPTIVGQKSTIGDVQVEKWDNAFGDNSGMRAVFVPADSPVAVQLGFTGMMLGTHFLDAAK